jgi:hypothetical protein
LDLTPYVNSIKNAVKFVDGPDGQVISTYDPAHAEMPVKGEAPSKIFQ